MQQHGLVSRGAALSGTAVALLLGGGAPGRATRAALPARGELTIRDAYLVTIDPMLGDIPKGDIHVRDGGIVAIGEHVKGGGAEIKVAGFIAMPGFVDTHQHMWTASFGLAGKVGSLTQGKRPI